MVRNVFGRPVDEHTGTRVFCLSGGVGSAGIDTGGFSGNFGNRFIMPSAPRPAATSSNLGARLNAALSQQNIQDPLLRDLPVPALTAANRNASTPSASRFTQNFVNSFRSVPIGQPPRIPSFGQQVIGKAANFASDRLTDLTFDSLGDQFLRSLGLKDAFSFQPATGAVVGSGPAIHAAGLIGASEAAALKAAGFSAAEIAELNTALATTGTAGTGAAAEAFGLVNGSLGTTLGLVAAPWVIGSTIKGLRDTFRNTNVGVAERAAARAPVDQFRAQVLAPFVNGSFIMPAELQIALAKLGGSATPELAGAGGVIAKKLGFPTGNGDVGGDVARAFGQIVAVADYGGFRNELEAFADNRLSQADFLQISNQRLSDKAAANPAPDPNSAEGKKLRAELISLTTGISKKQAENQIASETNQPLPHTELLDDDISFPGD